MQIPFSKKVVQIAEHGLLVWLGVFVTTYSPVILNAQDLHSLLDLSVLDKAATAAIAAVVGMVVSNVSFKFGDKKEMSFVSDLAKPDNPDSPSS